MIVDHRTYTIHPGKLNTYLQVFQELGLPLQQKHLGRNVGWYTSMDIGPLNQVVHLWAYDDLADRAARRAALAKEPGWGEFLKQAMPLVQTMENKILAAAPWFDLDKAANA